MTCGLMRGGFGGAGQFHSCRSPSLSVQPTLIARDDLAKCADRSPDETSRAVGELSLGNATVN